MPDPARLPERLQSPPTDPPERDPHKIQGAPYGVVPTACQYCIVGCGYEAHLWKEGNGTEDPPRLVQAHWVSPAMTGRVRYEGVERIAAVVPDPKCPLNKGNHSPRGGSQGRNLVYSTEPENGIVALPEGASRKREQDSTRERITTPYVRTQTGYEPLTVEQALSILTELVKAATGWKSEAGVVQFTRPEALGVKLYEYQYLENTFAATRLFFQLIGTPNVAYHDRPSVASNTQGFNDSGIDPHGYAYEDIWDSDVLFLAGNNPYESQSVFFMQSMAGKRIIVLDPRRTITADYAEKTGGLHLQPTVLGADTLVLNALARYIRDRRRQDPEHWPDRLAQVLEKKPDLIVSREELQRARGEAVGALPDQGPELLRRARYQLSQDEYLNEFLETQPDLSYAASVAGIPLAKLEEAARLLAGPALALPLPDVRKVSLIFEKGLIWGYSYQNTAAMANLGLLLGSVLLPGLEDDNRLGVTGRAGGHQKGWAEVRYTVEKVVDASGAKPPPWSAGYPFHNAGDEFQADASTRIRTHHNFDSHLVGTGVAPRHPRALPQTAEPDIRLLWVIGSNAVGQVGNAAAKWAEVARRRGDRLPASANPGKIVETLKERIRQGGLVVVQQDIYPNPTTLHADLVLPAAGWGEENFTRYNGERRLRLYGKFQDPPAFHLPSGELERDSATGAPTSRCLPDWRIFQHVARALLPEGQKGNGLHAGYMGDWLTRADFAWPDTAALFRDMALHSNLKDSLSALERGLDEQPKGHRLLRDRGTRGFVIPLLPDPDNPLSHHESLRVPVTKRWRFKDRTPYGFYSFVKADWKEIEEDFNRNRARTDQGEFFICNGRVNELWNSLFTHIRNETVRQRYPDDMPGTILEMHPEDADELGLQNGDVVEVECQQIHLGAKAGAFKGVVSRQPGAVPRRMVFAIFSYPAMRGRLEQFPFREFVTDAYVNNLTTGYVDPINPIAALKYARGKIRKTGAHYPASSDPAGNQEPGYLGPSYKPRNIAFITPRVEPTSERDHWNWKMRELIVQKGLVRATYDPHSGWTSFFRDPDLFLELLNENKAVRELFLSKLPSMKWPVDGKVIDAWSPKELQLVEKWLASLQAGLRFDRDIKPLFLPKDVAAMKWAFDLHSYLDVKAHAVGIYARLADGSMPCDGAWPDSQIAQFKQWMDEGMQP